MRAHFDTFTRASWALVLATTALGAGCGTTSERPSQESAVTPSREGTAAQAVVRELQATAERELERALAESKASGGTILVMSPKGEVVAEAGGHADEPYVAGSTMKPLLLAAAIDAAVVSEGDTFDCSHGERNGRLLRDATPLGRARLPDLVSRSSNVGFAQIFDRLGGARSSAALERFHFAVPPALAAAPPGDWDATMTAIGVTMTATPRLVARAYAALANGGEGIVKPGTASRVSSLLEGVVASEHGTGRKAAVAGVRVAGKTGTSAWTSPDGTPRSYASFVGYLPADHPRYVVFVGVESPRAGDSGGEVAAPVFSRVAARALAH
jgi:cell division protein FtsI (penicillin-binding protein 3)